MVADEARAINETTTSTLLVTSTEYYTYTCSKDSECPAGSTVIETSTTITKVTTTTCSATSSGTQSTVPGTGASTYSNTESPEISVGPSVSTVTPSITSVAVISYPVASRPASADTGFPSSSYSSIKTSALTPSTSPTSSSAGFYSTMSSNSSTSASSITETKIITTLYPVPTIVSIGSSSGYGISAGISGTPRHETSSYAPSHAFSYRTASASHLSPSPTGNSTLSSFVSSISLSLFHSVTMNGTMTSLPAHNASTTASASGVIFSSSQLSSGANFPTATSSGKYDTHKSSNFPPLLYKPCHPARLYRCLLSLPIDTDCTPSNARL